MAKTCQDLSLQLADFDEVTGQTTTSATLEDIAGLAITFEMTKPGRVLASMTVSCSSTLGVGNVGAWAININGVDGGEIPRYLSGTNDQGALAVQASAQLGAGTYTIKGRHRRVSGPGTINTARAQLSALMIG